MADETKKYEKILEKYGNDPAKVAAAYAELEDKLGSQGLELGDLRKKSEEYTKSLQQYADYTNKVKPVVDWYAQNQQKIAELWAQQGQPSQTRQSANMNASLLTPEEQQALIDQASKHFREKELAGWAQNFGQKAEEYVQTKFKEMQDTFDQRLKAYGQVWWKTLEHATPQDKLEGLKRFHEVASQYADPSKIDPFKRADAELEMQAKLADYETKLKAYEKEKEDRAKAETPSLGNGQGLFPRETDDKNDKSKAPQTRDDRYAAVINDVKTTHGNEGMAALFGPAPLR